MILLITCNVFYHNAHYLYVLFIGCFHTLKPGKKVDYIDFAQFFGGNEMTNFCTINFRAKRDHSVKLMLGTYNLGDSANCILEITVSN